MATLEDTIRKEAREYATVDQILEGFKNPETAYSAEARSVLGNMLYELSPSDPQVSPEMFNGASLEIVVPAAERLKKRKQKEYLEGKVDSNLDTALGMIPNENIEKMLYFQITPKIEGSTAEKHKKFSKLFRAINTENPDIGVYVDMIKDEDVKAIVKMIANVEPQRVLNSAKYYLAILQSGVAEDFAKGDKPDHDAMRGYVAQNILAYSPKERKEVYETMARAGLAA